MKGRKSLPAEIKNLRGTSQPSRENKGIDGKKIVNVSAPRILKTNRSKKIYREKARQLIDLKILTELDLDLLAIYASSMDMIFDAIENIDTDGKIEKIVDGEGRTVKIVQNPYLKLMKEQIEIVNKIGGEFGFSPVSRLKLVSQSMKQDEDDSFFN